ncbi:hypothetical protein REPUB_Repub17cG0138900 [Reevesia pubescens]
MYKLIVSRGRVNAMVSSARKDNLQLYHWRRVVNGVPPSGDYSPGDVVGHPFVKVLAKAKIRTESRLAARVSINWTSYYFAVAIAIEKAFFYCTRNV